MMLVRHGFMIVGDHMGGKTSAAKVIYTHPFYYLSIVSLWSCDPSGVGRLTGRPQHQWSDGGVQSGV